jgi:penicillin-binding protein 1A
MKNPFQTPFMRSLATHIRAFAATIPGRLAALRHPTWRGVGLGLAAIPLTLLLYTVILIPFTPSIGDIKKAKQEVASVVLSADGKELARFKRANRDWVKLSRHSPNVVEALIATEDHRFYDHHGIDFTRTAGGAGHPQGRRAGRLDAHAAAGTQPVPRGDRPVARRITRKLKEAITALQDRGGLQQGRDPGELPEYGALPVQRVGHRDGGAHLFRQVGQRAGRAGSATLVGMLKGTSLLQPGVNPERALQRRNTVLAQMVKHQKLPEAKLRRR